MNESSNYIETVRRKAKRMAAARLRHDSLFRHLAHVGVLSWMFVLPLVLSAFLGRLLANTFQRQELGLAALGVGLVTGIWLVWRQLSRSLPHEGEENDRSGDDLV
jgi:hypothetical protein